MEQHKPQLPATKTLEAIDRPRGILSKRDRQFLQDEDYGDDLAAQSRRNIRSRLRQRVRNAILDFHLLNEYLQDRDRDQVFDDIDTPLSEGLHAAMAFLYQAADRNPDTFAAWLEGGLKHIELDQRSRLILESPTVDLEITPGQSVDPNEAEAKITAGDFAALSPGELRFLLWKAGTVYGASDGEDPYLAGLAHYAERFEAQTGIAEAKELREETE